MSEQGHAEMPLDITTLCSDNSAIRDRRRRMRHSYWIPDPKHLNPGCHHALLEKPMNGVRPSKHTLH